MKIIFFYFFLILNFFNFQYVPGFRWLNNVLTSIRMFCLKISGATIGKFSIIRPGALIISAKNINIGSNTIIGSNSKFMNFEQVSIGNNVEIGPGFIVQTNEHLVKDFSQPLGKQGAEYKRVVIGDGCYIGGDVTILSGLSITKNCIIGAKSIVTKNINISGIYAGCPAKLIKEFHQNG